LSAFCSFTCKSWSNASFCSCFIEGSLQTYIQTHRSQ
jgi:hypothetical protein